MEKDAVVKKLKEKRRLLKDEILRRDLFVTSIIIALSIIYFNFAVFGLLPYANTTVANVVALLVFIFVLGGSFGICHYLNYHRLNRKFADEYEERLEERTGLFLKFIGREEMPSIEKAAIEDYNRLIDVRKFRRVSVTCINEFVDLYYLHYANNEKALLIKTVACSPTNGFYQMRNDVRVMAKLNGESPIKTYFPEADGAMQGFVGFASGPLGSDGFFDPLRREIANTLSDYPKFRYCLTEANGQITLLIDGLALRYGDSLFNKLDDNHFANRISVRKLIKTGVGIVVKTASRPGL